MEPNFLRCQGRVKGGEAAVHDPESRYRIGVSFQIENYRKTHKVLLDSGDSLGCSDSLDNRDVFTMSISLDSTQESLFRCPMGIVTGSIIQNWTILVSVYSVVVTTSVSKK
mmetsp:Transcript_28316/g.44165  ORF Transcript_28316/g.44165 Transcript_28316/m.44165 type:complete len:111 (-) Transcript_28316:57-389(-)